MVKESLMYPNIFKFYADDGYVWESKDGSMRFGKVIYDDDKNLFLYNMVKE